MLERLRAELDRRFAAASPEAPTADDRRRSPRVRVAHRALLVIDELAVPGTVDVVAAGGVFLSVGVLAEIGEQGTLTLDGVPGDVAVRVAWAQAQAPTVPAGLGLAFVTGDPDNEKAGLEMVIYLLDHRP